MTNKIKLSLFSLFLLMTKIGFSQADTIVFNEKFILVKRFKSGQIKLLGQFKNDCENKNKKHGQFIRYSKNGKLSQNKEYCHDRLINKKILGLKHGQWGACKGLVTLYFLGMKRTKYPIDSAPCL